MRKFLIMSDILSTIQSPISKEMEQFKEMFHESLSHPDGLLGEVLKHILKRGGKRMRPILTLLIAKALAPEKQTESVLLKTLHSACSLELLHTASLVHDDVVDESKERRGQKAVQTVYTNRIAILVGDYILSTSLKETAMTEDPEMVKVLSELGQTLSEGEVIQIQNISNKDFSIDRYYEIIRRKTAALFEACCHLAGLSVGVTSKAIEDARIFGQNIGIIFQIRDDIFDYFDNKEIGKPTGNDMREGKLTLPVLYVLNNVDNDRAKALAIKVKDQEANDSEIAELIEIAKANGGIEYAEKMMDQFYERAMEYIDDNDFENSLKIALKLYVGYVIGRDI